MQGERAERLLARAKRHADSRTETGGSEQLGIDLSGQALRVGFLEHVDLARPDHPRGAERRFGDERNLGESSAQAAFDLRVGMDDSGSPDARLFDEVNRAPVGKLRYEEPYYVFERRVGVKDLGQERADARNHGPSGGGKAIAPPRAFEKDDDDNGAGRHDDGRYSHPH